MPRSTTPPERVIQQQIIGYLEVRGWVVERMNSGMVPLKAGPRTRYVKLHTKGTPDVLAMRKGPDGRPEVLFVEVKKPGELPEAHQLERHAFLRERTGATVIVATSWEEVDTILATGA